MSNSRQKAWRRHLTGAVVLALLAGVGTQAVDAADMTITSQITGTKKLDSRKGRFPNVTITQQGDMVLYDFGKKNDVTFTQSMFHLKGGKQNLVLTGQSFNTPGLGIGDNKTVVINGNVNVNAVGFQQWGPTALAMTREGTGQGSRSDLLINGDVTIRGTGTDPSKNEYWGSYTTAPNIHGGYEETDGYMGTRWSATGINLGQAWGSTITIKGNVDIAAKGVGISTDPYYPVEGMDDKDLSFLNIDGGKIETPDNDQDGWYSVTNFGGTINLNMNKDMTASAGHDLDILGNMLVAKEYNGSGDPYFYQDGRLNLGLDTENSRWKGAIDNFGKEHAGEFNLFLSNGATWENKAVGKLNGLDAGHMPWPSNENHYSIYDGVSYLTTLHGGDSASSAGVVLMKHTDPLSIGTYSGNTTFIYEHANDGSSVSDYAAGSVTVDKAAENSVITFATDNENVKMTEEAAVIKTLDALAHKLKYAASTTGEQNLKGRAAIASGLTSSAKELLVGNMVFTGEGLGSVTELDKDAGDQELSAGAFATQIVMDNYGGNDEREYWEGKGILRADKSYVFDANTIINPTYDAAENKGFKLTGNFGGIMWAGDNDGAIDMQGHKLTINTTSDGTANTTATGIVNYSGNVTIKNVDSLSINGTDRYAVKGIVVDGATSMGQWDDGNGQAHLTIENEKGLDHAVKIRANRTDTSSGFYNMGIEVHRNVGNSLGILDINGLVDIELNEGKAGGIQIISSGKGLPGANYDPAVDGQFDGAQAHIGGGLISVKNGYTVGVSHNGVLDFNATEVDGYAQISDNDAPVKLDGNMQVAYLGKANIGFTNGSYLRGLAINSEETKGFSNFAMAEGSTWTNENTSNFVWEGQQGFLSALTKGSDINSLNSDNGVIEQKDSNDLVIHNFKGNATIVYGHDNAGTQASDFTAGNTIIEHADGKALVTLFTDSTGVDTANESEYEKVFDALAHKLYFKGVLNAEYGFKGKLKIASGLTASSGVLEGNIAFNDSTGQGFYTKTARPDQELTKFTDTITGNRANNAQYVDNGVLFTGETYTFRENATVEPTNGAPAVHSEKDLVVNASHRDLGLLANGSADTVSVLEDGQHTTTIKGGNLAISAMTSAGNAKAIHATGANSQVLVNGQEKTTIASVGIGGAHGILAEQGGKVVLTGATEVTAAAGGHGVAVEANTGSTVELKDGVTANGDNAIVAKDANSTVVVEGPTTVTASARSLVADGGSITVGAKADGDAIVLSGNMNALNNGQITASLKGENSSFTGLVDNANGQVDITLADKAEWTHKAQGEVATGFASSHVNTLEGGASTDAAGRIVMEGAEELHVDTVKGALDVIYAHEGNGQDVSQYKGGDIHFTHAEPKASLTLITDNAGISVDNEEEVDKVFTALAKKAYYENFKTGESNLYSLVKIASGLTSSAVTKNIGHMTYDAVTGQGKYVSATGTLEGNQILPSQRIPSYKKQYFEARNKVYKDLGVENPDGNFLFTQDLSIATEYDGALYYSEEFIPNIGIQDQSREFDFTDHNVTLSFNNDEGYDSWGLNIYARPHEDVRDNVDVTFKNINEFNMEAKAGADEYIRAGNIRAVDSVVTFDNVAHTNMVLKGNSNDSAILAYGYSKKAGFINPGKMDISVENAGPAFNIRRSLSGADASEITVGGGTFKTKWEDIADIKANGILNINPESNQDVVIEGSMQFEGGAIGNVHLTTADSSWKGALNRNKANVRLELTNGAVWNNEFKAADGVQLGYDDEDSFYTTKTEPYQYLATLQGADSAEHTGYVMRKTSNPLRIGKMEGFTTIVYEHENQGLEAADYKAGDTIIEKAAEGAEILVSTDNANIDMQNKEDVRATLNTLAGKIYYEGLQNGEKNLHGKVQIASGLTASATSQSIEKITFDKGTGQGTVKDKSTVELDPSATIKGVVAEDAHYADENVLVENGNTLDYTFTKDVLLESEDGESAIAVVDKDVVVKGENIYLDNRNAAAKAIAGITANRTGNLEIEAKNLEITTRNTQGRAEGISVTGTNKDKAVTVEIDADLVKLDVSGKGYALGVYTSGNSELTINADVEATGSERVPFGVVNAQPNLSRDMAYHNTSIIYAGSDYNIQKGSTVTVNGSVNLAVQDGAGVLANGGNSTVNLNGGGTIKVPDWSPNAINFAMAAQSGTINVNINSAAQSIANYDLAQSGAGHDVQIEGNIGLLNASVNVKELVKDSVVRMALDTKDSYWSGALINNFTAEQLNPTAPGVEAEKPAMYLMLANGGTWKHIVKNDGAILHDTSTVEEVAGGKDLAHAGNILQLSNKDIIINNAKNFLNIGFEKDLPAAAPAAMARSIAPVATGAAAPAAPQIKGGKVIIKNLTGDTAIYARTDSNGMDMQDEAGVTSVLTQMANRIYVKDQNVYADPDATDAEKAGKNFLMGRVGIASGLTNSAAYMNLREMTFDNPQGQGQLGEEVAVSADKGQFPKANVFSGKYESQIMKGVRSAMMNMAMKWRSLASTGENRLYDLHNGEDTGVWARVNRGKDAYHGEDTDFKSKFSGITVGVDKELGNDWKGGASIDYIGGDDTYAGTGTGEFSVLSGGVYATKAINDKTNLDLTARAGYVKDEFKVSNEIATTTVKGTYRTLGYGVGATLTHHMENEKGLFVEPMAGLTYSHLDGVRYNATAGIRRLAIDAEDTNSLVGRIGVTAGKKDVNKDLYVKAVLAHDFTGEVTGHYDSADGGAKTTSFSTKNTWTELALGTKYHATSDLDLQAEFARTIGSEFKNDWNVSASASYKFDFGGKVAKAAAPAIQMGEATTVAAPVVEAKPINAVAMMPMQTVVEEPTTEGQGMAMARTTEQGVVYGDATVHGDSKDSEGYDLPAVVVTANRTLQTLATAHADVSVVTRKQIEELHMTDVEEVLRTVPGVQFLNYGKTGMNANLSGIRINGSKDVVVLVDGVRMTAFQGPNNSGYFYASLLNNMDNIERVEVLRGSAGVMYGSDAKGGVINIITRKVNSVSTTVDVSAGSFSAYDQNIFTQGRADNVAYKAYYNRSEQGDITDGEGKIWPGHTKTISKGAEVAYDFNQNHKLTISRGDVDSTFSGKDFIYTNEFAGTYSSKNWTVRHNGQLTDKWSDVITFRNNKQDTFYGQYDEFGSTIFEIGSKYDYKILSGQTTYATDSNVLVLGAEYMKGQRLSSVSNSTAASDKPEISNKSVFVQNTYDVSPRISLSAGLRHDSPDVTNFVGSKNSKSYKAVYKMNDNTSVHYGSSDYYILPDLQQLYDAKYGNKELKASEGNTRTIGLTHDLGKAGVMTLNWFKTKEKTGMAMSTNPGSVGVFKNTENGIARGWNFQWAANFSKHLTGTIGWAHLFQHAEGDNFSRGYYPKDLMTFALNYNYGKWDLGVDGFYFMRRLSSNAADRAQQGWPANNYGVYNASINYSPAKDMTVYMKVENIFNKYWAEHTNVIHGGQPGSWYAMPGRAFTLGAKYKF